MITRSKAKSMPNTSALFPYQPSPQSLPQTRPVRSSVAKLVKMVFKKPNKRAHDDDKYSAISKEYCFELIDRIKHILGVKVKDTKDTKVKSPFAESSIKYDGEVVQKVLSFCYHHFDEDMKKKVSRIAEVENLDDFLKPESRVKGLSAEIVFEQLVEEEITVDDVLGDAGEFESVGRSVFSDYESACKLLVGKEKVSADEYRMLLKALVTLIYKSVLAMRIDVNMSFTMFDELTKYHTTDLLNIPIDQFEVNKVNVSALKKIESIDVFNPAGDSSKDGVMKNTVISRTISVHVSKRGKRVSFKAVSNGPKISILEKGEDSSIDQVVDSYMQMSRKLCTIVPKYHTIDCIDTVSARGGDSIERDTLLLMAILNSFTARYEGQYEVIYDDVPEHAKDLLATLKGYETDDHTRHNIVYAIINNPFLAKPLLTDFFHYFKYNGFFYARSVIGYTTMYFQTFTLHPLRIDSKQLKSIVSAYKGSPPLHSKDLNIELQQYILRNGNLTDSVRYRLLRMFVFTEYSLSGTDRGDYIHAFHGTKTIMHKQGDKEIDLISFLSCTFDISVALLYGTEDGSKTNASGIVYVFRIKRVSHYIYFEDNLKQLLLLPGTKVHIYGEVNVGNIRYVFCTVKPSEKGEQYCKDLHQAIIANTKVYSPDQFRLLDARPGSSSELPVCVDVPALALAPFSPKSKNMYIHKEYMYSALALTLQSNPDEYFHIKYTLHQLMISDCFHYLKHKSVRYVLLNSLDKGAERAIYTGWQFPMGYDKERGDYFTYDIGSFFVDCLMSNKMCMNYNQYLSSNDDTGDHVLAFFSCGMYDKQGIKELDFNAEEDPVLQLQLLEYSGMDGVTKAFSDERVLRKTHDKFLKQSDGFEAFLVRLKDSYISFIETRLTGMFDPATSKPTSEHTNLKRMVESLVDILTYRVKYYRESEDMLLNMLENSRTMYSGGRAHVLESTAFSLSGPKQHSISLAKRDPIVRVVNRKDPLDRNFVKNLTLSSEPNDGYFVSKADFDIIAKNMAIRAGRTGT